MHTYSGWRRWLTGTLAALCIVAVHLRAVEPDSDAAALAALRSLAQPLETIDDLAPLLEEAAHAQLVLLGEATHGTSEFYTWRAAISRRLIAEFGFLFIVVEGDWADIYRLNRYVKHHPGAEPDARAIMLSFRRWPTWMWANTETLELVEWLHAFNRDREPVARIGFYGMDVYGDDQALTAMLDELATLDGELATAAGCLYSPWQPFAGNMQRYAQSLQAGGEPFAANARAGLALLTERTAALNATDPLARLNLLQSAYVVINAEAHYRAMLDPGLNSWNKRADHFFDTAARLRAHYGDGARGIAWAHNTHIGDARATPMAFSGQRNIGMSARQALGADNVFAIGFGTGRGQVVAGRNWGSPMAVMDMPAAGPGSIEALLASLDPPSLWLRFDPDRADLRPLDVPRGHRAVGVVYQPEHEFPGNYVPTLLPRRYDAFIFLRDTTALRALAR